VLTAVDSTDADVAADSTTDELRCRGVNKQGDPCRSPFVDPATSYCRVHDPDKVAEVELMRIAGGRATSNEARIERRMMESSDLGGVNDLLKTTLLELHKLDTSPAVANSIASVSRALLAAREQALAEARQQAVMKMIAERMGGHVDIEELLE
jgi:hypothetical protein